MWVLDLGLVCLAGIDLILFRLDLGLGFELKLVGLDSELVNRDVEVAGRNSKPASLNLALTGRELGRC